MHSCEWIFFSALNLLFKITLTLFFCFVFKLSKQSDQAAHAQLIFDVLLNQLLAEYVDYALELGLQAVPIPETKVQPQLYFLQVASQTNEIVHFLDMETLQSLLPIVV